jgi:signal transduction histidine kinase
MDGYVQVVKCIHAVRRGVVAALLCLGSIGASAQAANVDSIRQVAAALPIDTASVMAVVKLSQQLRSEGHEEAEELAQRAVDMAQSIGDPRYIGEAMTCMGLVHGFRNNYDLALRWYLDAEKNFATADYEPGIAKCHLNIAAVYLARLNYDIAKRHLLIAQEIVERLDIAKYKVSINTNLAIIYTEEGQYDEALKLHEASLGLLADGQNLLQRSVCYSNIGYLYDKQSRPADAYGYYQKAYEAAMQDGGGRYYEGGFALLNMINALVLMERLPQAVAELQHLWPIATKSGSPLLIAETHRAAARIHARAGNHRQAYADLEQFVVINDSLKNVDMNTRMAALQKEYDILKRDMTIAKIEQESASMRAREQEQAKQSRVQVVYIVVLAVVGALFLVAFGIMVFAMYSRSRVLDKLRASYDRIRDQNQEIETQNMALKRQNDHLEDLNREKDGLVGIVAHDLKAPLNKALALSELLRLQGSLNDDQLRSVGMMGKVASAGNDLIRDLLDLNTVEQPDVALQPEQVDLVELLQELEAGYAGEAQRKAIVLQFELAAGLPKIYCDRKALIRVMDNLLSNAIKFSPRDRAVHVRARLADAGTVCLQVADQGPGISREDQQKMFKKFQRLSALPTGGENSTGLGLAIAKALTQKLGGTIQLESTVGRGATFSLCLPLQPPVTS